jgi:hypothetical protein
MPTVEVAPRGPRPPIRVRPVPRCDPPFDDELEPQVWSSTNQLAFEWPAWGEASPPRADVATGGTPVRRLSTAQRAALLTAPPSALMAALRGQRTAEVAAAASRLGPPTAEILAALFEASAEPARCGPSADPAQSEASADADRSGACADAARTQSKPPHPAPDAGAAPRTGRLQPHSGMRTGPWRGPAAPPPMPGTTAGASGDAKLAVRRFVHMCVEVLNGYRPAAHLRRLALPKEAAGVVAQAVAGMGRVAELRRATRAAEHRRDRRPGPVGVIRLQLCEPRPGAVEAAVVLITGERTWAMALRLELHQQTWCATTLRLV